MIELIAVQRLDDGDIVHHLTQVRKQLRELGARFAVTLEGVGGGQDLGRSPDKSEPLPFQGSFGNVLTVQLLELGLVLEQVDLGGSTRHEEEDDVLGLRRKVRHLGGQRTP